MSVSRSRKPVAQKILEGTYRADRDGEPVPRAEVVQAPPEPPGTLSGEALAFWRDVVPGLVSRGVVTSCDTSQLVVLCEWWARYRKASDDLEAIGPGEKGAYQRMLMVGIATTNFDKIAAKFGLTPTDRAKLRCDPATAPRRVDARKR